MIIEVKRFDSGPHDTLGKMYIDGKFACYTLEDEFRPVKVRRETRIPDGNYKITFRREGGFHARYSSRFPELHLGMLWIRNIPNFEYVLIHVGNTEDDTAGCILVGKGLGAKEGKRAITSSVAAYKQVYPVIARALELGEDVELRVYSVGQDTAHTPTAPDEPIMTSRLKPKPIKYCWILDNASGIDDRDARSPLLFGGFQFKEYEFTRAVVRRLKEKLDAQGIPNKLLVPEENHTPDVVRIRRANVIGEERKSILVSVRANATGTDPWNFTSGVETTHYPSSSMGRTLADKFQSHLTTTLDMKNRGLKSSSEKLLKKTVMPAICTYNGYYTNYVQCLKMMSGDFVELAAEGHYKAISEFA